MNFSEALIAMRAGAKVVRKADAAVFNYIRAAKRTNGLWSLVYVQHGFKNEYPYKPTNSDIFADDWRTVE